MNGVLLIIARNVYIFFSVADVKACFYLFKSKGQVTARITLTARVDKVFF
jgi:hypothetical protein